MTYKQRVRSLLTSHYTGEPVTLTPMQELMEHSGVFALHRRSGAHTGVQVRCLMQAIESPNSHSIIFAPHYGHCESNDEYIMRLIKASGLEDTIKAHTTKPIKYRFRNGSSIRLVSTSDRRELCGTQANLVAVNYLEYHEDGVLDSLKPILEEADIQLLTGWRGTKELYDLGYLNQKLPLYSQNVTQNPHWDMKYIREIKKNSSSKEWYEEYYF